MPYELFSILIIVYACTVGVCIYDQIRIVLQNYCTRCQNRYWIMPLYWAELVLGCIFLIGYTRQGLYVLGIRLILYILCEWIFREKNYRDTPVEEDGREMVMLKIYGKRICKWF